MKEIPKHSKKMLKKEEKKVKKKLELKEIGNIEIVDKFDFSSDSYGLKIFPTYKSNINENYIKISEINNTYLNVKIKISGFLHQVRKTGKQAFMIMRQAMNTVQCIAYTDETRSKQMIQFIGNIPKESVIEVVGVVVAVNKPVESCTNSSFEINVEKVYIVSKAKTRLPLQIEDAMRPESDKSLAKVNLDTRLDNRVLDLRTLTNQAIFSITDKIVLTSEIYLSNQGFKKVLPSYIQSGASEGGAGVFEVNYFGEKAYLAQSPQLYKQMAIVGGFEYVYIIGPVFRAENSNTHRHLTEFWGLDIELVIKYHYHEVLDFICETMVHVFKTIESTCQKEISIVNKQYPADPFQYLEPTLILTFAEGVDLLRTAGLEMGDYDDLTTTNEKILGKLIKEKYQTDFYVLDRFPSSVRPFYTMLDPIDKNYSNSYDIFMRGEEIMSGSQRIHDAETLRASALKHGINLDSIKDYLESFEYACKPHGGGGIGLERVVMLYLGLDNIRLTSLFPHDPKRIRP